MTKRPVHELLLALPPLALITVSCFGDINPGSKPTGSAPGNGSASTGGTNTNPNGTTSTPSTTGPASPAAPVAFEALPPRSYATKVKDLLTGLPLSESELAAVVANPQALRGLIDTWMTLPQYKEKMLEFFRRAFQQTQIDPLDLDDQLKLASNGVSSTDQRNMVKSVEESFARTILALVEANHPFTEAATTTTFMLNVPMMVAMSYIDAAPVNDLGQAVSAGYWLLDKFGRNTFKFTLVTNLDPVTGLTIPIPLEETVNPNHANFMKWTFRQPDPLRYMPCKDVIPVTGTGAINSVFRALFGGRQNCQGAQSEPTLFSADDWNTWKMVTVRPPKPGEERTVFWEVPKLRDPKTTELVLNTPRVGFFSTLAFFANWPTNPSNSYRVTLNQALIVALGRSFDDRATVAQVSETSVDAQHVQPGSVCYPCHQTLDPMRNFFTQSYSMMYSQQLSMLNPKTPTLPEGVFTVDGSPAVRGMGGVDMLGRALADHPMFATSWTQKLCQQANATPCLVDDPELKRVAGLFAQSKFDWKTLVRELFSSPLVTYTARTKTSDAQGVSMSIARRENFCTRLGNRLDVKDLCNQRGESTLPRIATIARNLSLGIAGSTYSRADENPVMPHDSNLFFVSGTEKLCGQLAGQLVEVTATSPWTSAKKDAAIADFVRVIMGVPTNDPRAPELTDILTRHYAAAITAKERPADALRSTFTLACSSPLAVSSGL